MIYNDFKDLKLSALGMGCMRFPTLDEDNSNIDEAAVCEMVDYAIEKGINYFDTAWGYHKGMSETVIGKALARHPRESFYLASKFPGFNLPNLRIKEEIFEKQLEKCGVDYFDFYLFHNVCELNIDGYLSAEFGIYEYLMEQKRKGRIKHLGFSTHGTLDTMKRFLDAYGKDMEFCQIQLNWLDWDFQNAKAKAELLKEWNIPIWVMEPLRGGNLVKLSPEHEDLLRVAHPEMSVPEWAFRFLQSIDDVKMTLSGMSNFQQLKENLDTYETQKPLDDNDVELLFRISKEMTSRGTVPCTACSYCTSQCPMELNIPWLLELYNEHSFSGSGFIAPMAMASLDESKKPSACIGCRSCEAVCPQNIKISEVMSDFVQKME